MNSHNNLSSSETSAMQLSCPDRDGGFLLSVIAKRTYLVKGSEQCIALPEESKLTFEPLSDPQHGDCLHIDSDVYPFKMWTDIIVKGAAYNHPQTPSFSASLSLGNITRNIQVFGPRQCGIDSLGKIIFSSPSLINRVELSYCNAYGGCDSAMASEWSDIVRDLLVEAVNPRSLPPDQAAIQALSYPRNPAGRGYLIEATKQALEQTSLPLLEDAADLLRPERLVVGELERWPKQPMPTTFGWINHGWFPRSLRLGIALDEDLEMPLAEFAEIRRCGWSESDLLPRPITEHHAEGANGAEPWLQLPYLDPAQAGLVRCVNLHPRLSAWSFCLPSERPRLFVDGRNGRLLEVSPVLHSLTIEPDKDRISLVWRGSARARRPYLPAEIVGMPFRVMW